MKSTIPASHQCPIFTASSWNRDSQAWVGARGSEASLPDRWSGRVGPVVPRTAGNPEHQLVEERVFAGTSDASSSIPDVFRLCAWSSLRGTSASCALANGFGSKAARLVCVDEGLQSGVTSRVQLQL